MHKSLSIFFNPYFVGFEKQKLLYDKSVKYDYLFKISEKQKMKINKHNEKQYKLNNKNDVSFVNERKFKIGGLGECGSISIKNIFSKCKEGLDMKISMGIIYFDKFMEL